MIKIEIIDDIKKNIIKNNIRILLVTSADIEKEKLNEKLKPIMGESDVLQYNYKSYEFYIGKFGIYNVVHIQTKIGSMGDGASTLAINDALQIWNIKMVVMIGIAFGRGIDCNQKIGDILISRDIYMYEKYKIKENKEGAISCQHLSNPYYNAGEVLFKRFKDDKIWNSDSASRAKIHVGTIASGEKIIDSSEQKRKILEMGNTTYIIGGEMEAAGLAAACLNNKINEWIVVKGISDFGDGNKVKNQGVNQSIAISNAVSYCEYVFSKEKIFDDLIEDNAIKMMEDIYSFPINMNSKDIDFIYSYETSLVPVNAISRNVSKRQDLIEKIKQQIDSGKSINIYGEIYSGKTTIIRLLANQLNEIKYIDLSENDINQIEKIIIIIYKIMIEIGNDLNSTIVIDNLPKLKKNTKIYNIFIRLLKQAAESNVKVIFSSLTSLESTFENEIDDIYYASVDDIGENDVVDLLKIYEAPEFMYDKKIIQFIETIGKNKIFIIKQIIVFLKEQKWDFLNNGFIGVFDGKYFLKTKGEIQDILLSRIQDERSKELLYRIGCVNTDLSLDEIKQICEIKPFIDRPLEILSELNGKFIELDEETNLYKINPLISQISKDNIQNSIYIKINSILAQNILDKRTLNPYEIIKCLGYLNQAKEYNRAGRLYIQTLIQMYDENIKDEWGIRGIWKDMELPNMDSYLKLQVRVAQLRYYLKFRINYEETLSLTIKLIERENYEDFLIAGISVLFIEENPYRFNELLRMAITSKNKNKKILKTIQNHIPKGKYSIDNLGVESLLWATIPKNGEIELFSSWVDTLITLNKEQYNIFKNAVNKFMNMEEMYVYYIDKTWIYLKNNKSDDIEKIKKLILINQKIIDFGKKVEDNFITAISIRNIVIFKCEYLKDLKGFDFGIDELKNIQDYKSKFIVTSMIGKQYYYLKKFDKAIFWLEKALEFDKIEGELAEKIWVLLELSDIYGERNKEKSYVYAKETLKYISSFEFENKARFYMEYLIRCFFLDKLGDNLEILLECTRIVIKHKEKRGMVAFFTHILGYFTAYIINGVKLDEENEEYGKPYTRMTIYFNNMNDDLDTNKKIKAIYMHILKLLSYYKRKEDMINFYLDIHSELEKNGMGITILFPSELRIFLIEKGYFEEAIQLSKIMNVLKNNNKSIITQESKEDPLEVVEKTEELLKKNKDENIEDLSEVLIFNIIFLLINKNNKIKYIEKLQEFQKLDDVLKNEYKQIVQTIIDEKKLTEIYLEFLMKSKEIEKNEILNLIYRLLYIDLLKDKKMINYQINLIIYFSSTYGKHSTEESLLKLFINQIERNLSESDYFTNKDSIQIKINEFKESSCMIKAKRIYIECLIQLGFDNILEENITWLKENDKN